MRVYFAHPVTDYGTERQAGALAVLLAAGFDVESPDQPHHQNGYQSEGMAYFTRLVGECDGLVFLRFPNGSVGAGVGKEIGAAADARLPIWDVSSGQLKRMDGLPNVMSVEETRTMLAQLRRAPVLYGSPAA